MSRLPRLHGMIHPLAAFLNVGGMPPAADFRDAPPIVMYSVTGRASLPGRSAMRIWRSGRVRLGDGDDAQEATIDAEDLARLHLNLRATLTHAAIIRRPAARDAHSYHLELDTGERTTQLLVAHWRDGDRVPQAWSDLIDLLESLRPRVSDRWAATR